MAADPRLLAAMRETLHTEIKRQAEAAHEWCSFDDDGFCLDGCIDTAAAMRDLLAAMESAGFAVVPRDLLDTAKLLYANMEGCLIQHHGWTEDKLPGWLANCKASIERAVIAASAAGGEDGR